MDRIRLKSHAEEFQIIYVDTPRSRRRGITLLLKWGDFLPKNLVWKWQKKEQLYSRESNKHYLSQLSKVNINSDIMLIVCTFGMMRDVMKIILYSVVFLSKMHNPSLTMRKTQIIPN